jgi:hypothetical protein
MAENVIPVESGNREKPAGLLETVGEIQRFYVAESGGSVIPEDYFTIDMRMEYFWLGMRSVIGGGVLIFFFMPLLMGVLTSNIPVFGQSEATLFDKIYIILMTLMFSLGYAFFLSYAARFNGGNVTRLMLKNLYSGATFGSVFKGVVSFIFYNFLYFIVLTESNIYKVLSKASFMSSQLKSDIYTWIIDVRPTLLSSSVMIIVVSIIYITICWVSYFASENRKKGMEKKYGSF